MRHRPALTGCTLCTPLALWLAPVPTSMPLASTGHSSGSSASSPPPQVQISTPPGPYSVFSRTEKRMMMALDGFAMLFSPLTANIYFPAMSQLETDLDASPQLINLTITSYLVFQAVAPALFGDLADALGRRPAFLAMFAVYSVANLGLALQRSFPALLALRMVQSLGASATVAVSYGLVADIVTAAERGGVIGVTMIATNLGPALAPLIGGAILGGSGSWQWIFWFLLLCGALELLLLLFLLPETARGIVGNGSLRPPAWRRPLLSVLVPSRGRIPNPLRSIRVIFYKDSFLVLLISGIYYCLQASIALTLRKQYPHFSDTIIGACYLSIGCGVVVGGCLNGRLLNRNYAVIAAEVGHSATDKDSDLDTFPIERARLHSMRYLQLLHLGPLMGYGWMMQKGVHVSAPLIFHFVLGFLETCIVQTCNTLLVDIFQDKPSVAAASGNIVRCGLLAAGIAVMEPLMERMGLGWYFTLLSLLGAAAGIASCEVLKRKGMNWRRDRRNGAF
ncbi:multidrug resistance protein [Chaetomium tenue]|uniref:Multidrug resistance protein n=1 Tax=Chaetomium tenue TaxID=1854479 RepID=A0ACB7P894_9PEZI|nr:multidrug resistance protein [Chaetomium globosum]